MQLLFDQSFEYGDARRAWADPRATSARWRRTRAACKVPHMGWNSLDFQKPDDPLLRGRAARAITCISCTAFTPRTARPRWLPPREYGVPVAARRAQRQRVRHAVPPRKKRRNGACKSSPTSPKERERDADFPRHRPARRQGGAPEAGRLRPDDRIFRRSRGDRQGLPATRARTACTWWIWTARRTGSPQNRAVHPRAVQPAAGDRGGRRHPRRTDDTGVPGHGREAGDPRLRRRGGFRVYGAHGQALRRTAGRGRGREGRLRGDPRLDGRYRPGRLRFLPRSCATRAFPPSSIPISPKTACWRAPTSPPTNGCRPSKGCASSPRGGISSEEDIQALREPERVRRDHRQGAVRGHAVAQAGAGHCRRETTDADETHYPLPGREKRPRGEGRELRRPARRGRPRGPGRVLQPIRRGRAGVLRYHRELRGPAAVCGRTYSAWRRRCSSR